MLAARAQGELELELGREPAVLEREAQAQGERELALAPLAFLGRELGLGEQELVLEALARGMSRSSWGIRAPLGWESMQGTLACTQTCRQEECRRGIQAQSRSRMAR